jgi:pilus assembly protein CpaE
LASWTQGEVLRVLLVSTHEELRDQVERALAVYPAEHRLYWVSQPDLAPGRVRDLNPHAILLDDEALGSRPDEYVSQLIALAPDAGVLALVDPTATDRARQAVLGGARGFVPKPAAPDDLIAAIRQVLSRQAPPVEPVAPQAVGRVVVFCAPKGGTGRTTLAINTSISLLQVTGQPIVLMDADYAAPAIDVALNLRGMRDVSELRSKMSRLDRDLVAGILAHHESGLSVMLAPPPAEMSGSLSLPHVEQVVVWLRRMYPWVIVDLGLPLDETAFAFLDCADLICLSVPPEMIGLRNTRLMYDQLVARGFSEDAIWLILNRDGLPSGVKKPVIEEWLGHKIRYAIPNDQALATETVNRGVPFVLGHRRSLVAKACVGLASELTHAFPEEPGAAGAWETIAAAPAAGKPGAPPPRRWGRVLKPAFVALMAILFLALLAWRIVWPLRGVQMSAAGGFSTATVAALAALSTPAYAAESGPASTAPSPVEAAASAPAVPDGQSAGTGGFQPTTPGPAATGTPAAVLASPRPNSLTRTPKPTRTPTPPPTPTGTDTPSPTPTSTSEPTATPTLSPTPRPAPAVQATRAATPRPSPTPIVPAAVSLGDPQSGDSRSGKVTFTWQPRGALPAGAAYEVVVWYPGEDPVGARGVAPPTTENRLTVDLDGLYNFGQIRTGELLWTVLTVRTDPYVRLTKPTESSSRLLIFQPPAGGGGGTPKPPVP